MKIGKFNLNQGRTFVIAEIGGNHEGDFEKAKRMVREAAKSGADAVKFQILRAEYLVSDKVKVKAYSGISHRQQLERFKSREFSLEQYRELKELADECSVEFMASVFDEELVDMIDDLVPAYKIASGDMTYKSLLLHMKKKKKPLIVSTGAANLAEIRRLVKWVGKKNLIILHCICAYPAPYDETNLLSIPYLRHQLKIPVGFSDHSVGTANAIASIALGACVIEKHFTMDPDIPYGDHKLSVTPEQLMHMVQAIRVVEKSLGKYGRRLMPCEKRSRNLVRRSYFMKSALDKGKKLRFQDLIALRPVVGIPVEAAEKIVGSKLKVNAKEGAAVTRSLIHG